MKEEKQIKNGRSDRADKETLSLLAELLQGIPEAAVIVDRLGHLVLVNDSFCILSGYGASDLKGQPLSLLVPVRHQDRHGALVDSFWGDINDNIQVHKQVFLLARTGREIPVDIRLRKLAFKGGFFACATVRDVTEEKRAAVLIEQDYAMQQMVNDVLKLSLESLHMEKQLGKILSRLLAMPQLALLSRGAIYTVDESGDGLVLRAAVGFEYETDQPCGKILPGRGLCGRAIEEGKMLYAPCSDCSCSTGCSPAFRHGHYCVPIKKGDTYLGLINLYLSAQHKREVAEERCLSMVADALAWVISHHRAEEEKWGLQRKLAESARLAILGRLSGRFAHEIRNPLTAIGGFARRLQKNRLPQEKVRDYATLMVNEVERLENVLRNLITMSQPEVGEVSPHDINEIINYLLNGFAEECRGKKISVESTLPDLPQVPMNPRLVREAIENIFSNAIDSMPDGGRLTVKSEEYSLDAKRYALITVSDTGPGIPAKRMAMIYEPFYTSKTAHRRIGLGLASTKKIVEDHHGFISIDSEEGKGTTVRLAFRISPMPQSVRMVLAEDEQEAEETSESAACDRELNILKSAVEHANEAFVTIDSESRVVFFNLAAEKIFGVSREEVLGREITTLIGGDLGEQHRQAMSRYLETGESSTIGHEREMGIRRKDGSRLTVSLSFSVAENRGKIYCTGVVRDLSDFKTLQQKIIDAERLAALGQTVAEISHEIKNPLITIGGLARQLQKQQVDEKTAAKLRVIAAEVERLENLLVELRDLYRPRKLDISQFNMMDLLREVKDLLTEDLERKKIQLTFSPAFGGTVVQADRTRIKQVLLNVLKNGLEAMEGGGSLSLQIVSGPATVEVIVKDSGPGIAPPMLKHIFDPFFTTKRQGTGLGLSISKRIVEEHEGGLLQLKSEEGLGTEVRISLPRHQQ